MNVEVINNELVIRIPLTAPTPSKSGKTLVVASSHGNVKTSAVVQGAPITVGLNAFIYADQMRHQQRTAPAGNGHASSRMVGADNYASGRLLDVEG